MEVDLTYFVNLAYIVACLFFIVGIKKLGKPSTARQGNLLSSLGMLICVVVVFFKNEVVQSWNTENWLHNGVVWILVAMSIGTVIGVLWSKRVTMTGMPELVALYNGFGGLASFLVAVSQFLYLYFETGTGSTAVVGVSIGITVLIGAIAFTGSILAWAKHAEKVTGSAVVFPGQKIINLVLVLVALGAIVLLVLPGASLPVRVGALTVLAVTSFVLGVTLVLPIGGGDMPVVISLINSLTGLAVAMAGFMISNTVLVVSGALVGASGMILTLIMCKAMNRSIRNLLFSGFGAAASQSAQGPGAESKSVTPEDAYPVLEAAQSVVFIPGYGMAVAQAQHAVKELAEKLEENGADVSFAVHPVAGRMPGHMNVLLAEADIPYEQLKTMDEINPLMPQLDVAVVIGANDVVNPAAETDTGSPIYGMPIIKAHEAKTVFVLKRGKGRGFSGIENELFGRSNTLMVYGDAKATLAALAKEFSE